MFETAADNASILSIDLGLLIGLLVLQRLLDPSLGRDLILFGTTVASLLIVYVCVALVRHPSAIRDFRAELLAVFVLCLRSSRSIGNRW
jgi:hypothetical protein